MEVLLIEDVQGLGRKMEVKEVSGGYARNFLFPKKLAVPADRAALKQKTEEEAKRAREFQKRRDAAKKVAETPLTLHIQTGVKGEVYGSLTRRDIENALHEKGFGDIRVKLSKPIRELGERSVEADLGGGVAGIVKLIVLPQP